jgi:DNA-binding LacI/PurR family transcriptional regulator
MSPSAKQETSRDRVRGYRERLRRQGLRPIQIWVPDTRSPAFVAEAHRQSAAIAASQHEAEEEAFIDAIADR